MKVKKTVTVTFMSGPTEKARQWTFPRWLFHAFFVLGIFLVTGGISLVFFYVHEAQQLVTYRRLIQETTAQKSHLDKYRKELEGLEAQLSEVNLLNGQIRQMTAGQESSPGPKVPQNVLSPVNGTSAIPETPSAMPSKPSLENGDSPGASSQTGSPVSKGIRFLLPPENVSDWTPPLAGWETSPFGKRKSPLGDGEEFHTGLDIAQVEGARVQAAAGGGGARGRKGRGLWSVCPFVSWTRSDDPLCASGRYTRTCRRQRRSGNDAWLCGYVRIDQWSTPPLRSSVFWSAGGPCQGYGRR